MITTAETPTIKDESWKTRKDERRNKLIELSNEARAIRDEEGLECPLNDIIIERFYSDESHTEFHTFNGWRKLGYKVTKGSEAFVIWGKKRKVEVAQSEETENEEEKSYKFFPLAYLFSNQQVEKR